MKEITIPNVLLNIPSDKKTVTRFFSGDWRSFEENFLSKEITDESLKFDLILTSETIYNVENQSKLVSIFKNFLKKDGEVLVAAKTVYFGVGGGVRQFERLVKQENLKSESRNNTSIDKVFLKYFALLLSSSFPKAFKRPMRLSSFSTALLTALLTISTRASI